MTSDKIILGISSCLMGNNVRFDGGHKNDDWLMETLGPWVEWVPVCPEVECGLSVPREALRLVGDPEAPRLVHVKSGIDQTQRMIDWSVPRIEGLKAKSSVDMCSRANPLQRHGKLRSIRKKGPPARSVWGFLPASL